MSTISQVRGPSPEPALFEAVAEEVFRRYGRNWKPATLKVNQAYLRNQIMPWFRERPVADITRPEVREWFGSLHATPTAANRSLPILSVILRQAEIYGYRPEKSNPCRQVRRYPERGRERFLTRPEIRELGRALGKAQGQSPLQVAIVRLLVLTGCRQSEIRTLRWRDYREGHLFLSDSKAGPRTVWLSSAARKVLNELRRTSSFAFPALGRAGPMSTETLYSVWRRIRTDASLSGLRLHDLRHTYASIALQNGESLVTIGRLLGHRDPNTTLKYTHFNDPALRTAVEVVADSLQG